MEFGEGTIDDGSDADKSFIQTREKQAKVCEFIVLWRKVYLRLLAGGFPSGERSGRNVWLSARMPRFFLLARCFEDISMEINFLGVFWCLLFQTYIG